MPQFKNKEDYERWKAQKIKENELQKTVKQGASNKSEVVNVGDDSGQQQLQNITHI